MRGNSLWLHTLVTSNGLPAGAFCTAIVTTNAQQVQYALVSLEVKLYIHCFFTLVDHLLADEQAQSSA
eukprot:6326-Heterococcus_DN1.PRE.1